MVTGISAFAAVQAALAEQARDRAAGAAPRPRVLDVSLMQAAAALMGFNIAEQGLLGRVPPLANVPAGTYQGSDGRWVMVALLREPEFDQMCEILDLPELATDPRFASFAARAEHRDALLPILREAFRTRPAAEWVERFQAARMLCDLVNTPLDWLADPHVQAVAPRCRWSSRGSARCPSRPCPASAPGACRRRRSASIPRRCWRSSGCSGAHPRAARCWRERRRSANAAARRSGRPPMRGRRSARRSDMPVDVKYTTAATATGGRDGRSKTEDGSLDVKLATPKDWAAAAAGQQPGAALRGRLRGLLPRRDEARRLPGRDREGAGRRQVKATVGIGPRSEGGFGLDVQLDVSLPGVPREEAQALVEKAHQVCPYSNATRNNVPVRLNVV